jgi:protein-disulfide isomerase
MRMRLYLVIVCLTVAFLGSGAVARAADAGAPEPDPRSMRFVERAIAWHPGSVFRLLENTRYQTAQGSYRFVSIDRTCDSKLLSEQPTALIDEDADTIWLGSVGELPAQGIGKDQQTLKDFLSGFLPEALRTAMNLRVKVEWDSAPRRPGAVLPLNLLIETGYGTAKRPAGVTADGRFLVMGAEASLKDDPIEVRRRQFAASDLVVWDSNGGSNAKVEIIEFSDLECPACKSKWPLIKQVLTTQGDAVRHGMVSYPLTMIHPWSFRAASASWCVAAQDPEMLISFKETFYELQRDMEVSEVTPTAIDFVAGHNLDEAQFLACYLRDPSIAGVHRQMTLGNALGVRATPTYFVNGWMVQVPDRAWFPDMVARLVKGEEP